MLLSEKYCVCGLITDLRDSVTKQPRKRLAIRFPDSNTTSCVDIPFITIDNPGQLKLAAHTALVVPLEMVYVANKLKRLLNKNPYS